MWGVLSHRGGEGMSAVLPRCSICGREVGEEYIVIRDASEIRYYCLGHWSKVREMKGGKG